MKKGLIFLMGIVSFLGINTVSAEEIYFEYETNINDVKPYIDNIGYDTINKAINEYIKYYNESLSNEYPYYFISLSVLHLSSNDEFHIVLTVFEENDLDYFPRYFDQTFDSSYIIAHPTYSKKFKQYSYNIDSNSIYELDIEYGLSYLSIFDIDLENSYKYYNPYNYYYSNFDFYYRGDLFDDNWNGELLYLYKDDTLYFPLFDNSERYSVYNASSKFIFEPYYLYDNNDSLKEKVYTTINLNDYPYVALSLKDYNTIPESNSSVYTNISVKGQLCITPVYNYGMTERKDILTGTQVQRCSSYYNDFTSTRMYFLKTDVENHAIYYLKAYDTSKENIIKVDTSVFDISYITEDTKDNPYVSISGKQYPTIAYDNLTDTATKSEDEDYISGVSCPVGDFNCYNEYNSENIFTDLFDKPLEMLKSVWSAIISIFDLIAQFIALLPPTMQGFLYFAFGIGIILGVIKILL